MTQEHLVITIYLAIGGAIAHHKLNRVYLKEPHEQSEKELEVARGLRQLSPNFEVIFIILAVLLCGTVWPAILIAKFLRR